MELELSINSVIKSLEVAPQESLLTVLRREGYYSVKHGCENGECGACTVLVDGVARPACVTLAAQAGGCALTTVESLAQHTPGEACRLHPLQEAFIDTGAIQCGFCTPGMLLSACALLKRNTSPSEEEIREALSGNLCRCSGYVKPVQAVQRAAAIMRGEEVPPISQPPSDDDWQPWEANRAAPQRPVPVGLTSALHIVGQAERKIDGVKLATGKPAFVDDREMRDMLSARILTSPHAHAVIHEIDVSEARALPGVHAVLTYKDVQRAANAAANQDRLEPGPHDRYALDERVRFVGDRVAVVAAETPEIAEQALKLIQVNYEVLPAVLDPRLAISPQAPCIHPEPDAYGIYDSAHNIAGYAHVEIGDVEVGFAQADLVVESEYIVPPVQQVPLENHCAITYWDENDRLVVRSSVQAPYRVRRLLSALTGLPTRRIRVVTASVGGNFGAKQDVLVEDLCALLTIATARPVRLEYSRAEEFSGTTRHAQIIHIKTGVRRDGRIVANSMQLLTNTGAYGAHALNVQSDSGAQALSLYPCPNLRFEANIVYTNLPPASAFIGYGTPQSFFALESQMDEVANRLGMDTLELRRRNWLKIGDAVMLTREPGTNWRERAPRVQSSGLAECLRVVEEKLHWKEQRGRSSEGRLRRGVGAAIAMHVGAETDREMAAASLKLNDDGSFNLLVDASASGSETILAQIVAEVLGVRIEDIVVHSSDTDVTPFTLSSSIALNGGAAKLAAEQVRGQLFEVAGHMLKVNPEQLGVRERVISAPDGQHVTIAQVALHSLYRENQQQIMATASWRSDQLSPSFAAQGVEVEVDSETGVVRVLRAISAIDVGRVLNPVLVEGQIEGGVAQALGYSLSEELLYGQQGNPLTVDLSGYRLFSASDMPVLETSLVETDDPSGPFGVKDGVELAIAGLAPAVANAVADALGIRLRQIPLTPERVLRALRAQAQNG